MILSSSKYFKENSLNDRKFQAEKISEMIALTFATAIALQN